MAWFSLLAVSSLDSSEASSINPLLYHTEEGSSRPQFFIQTAEVETRNSYAGWNLEEWKDRKGEGVLEECNGVSEGEEGGPSTAKT